MSQVIFLVYLTILSSLVFSCGTPPTRPTITVCVLDPAEPGLDCYDARAGASNVLTLQAGDGYVCIQPNDFKTLMASCGPQ